MTNPKRGELRLTIGTETFQVKITMDTIMRIETALGRGILKIAGDLQDANMSALEMITILLPVLRSSGRDFTEKQVGELIWEHGFAEGLKAIAEIMAFMLTKGNNEGNVVEAVALKA